jgi:hypothetical protein
VWFEHCAWDFVIRDPVVRQLPEAVAESAANDATPVDHDVIVHPDCVFLEAAGHSLKMDPVGLVHRGALGWGCRLERSTCPTECIPAGLSVLSCTAVARE